MAHFDSSSTSALSPEEILQNFLASHGIGVSLEQSAEVCAACRVTSGDSTREISRRLEKRISKLGFKLKPKYAIEAIRKITSYSRCIDPHQRTNDAEPVFVVFLTVDGEEIDSAYYPNIGEAVTAILETTLELTPAHPEPALCNLLKLPSGFILDMRQAKSLWFELFLNCFRGDSVERGLPTPVWLDEDEVRAAFDRVVEGIESARPAVLINGGAVPRTVQPWCKAWFQVISENENRIPIMDEIGLFQFLDWSGCTDLTTKDGQLTFLGTEGQLIVEIKWVNKIPAGKTKVYAADAKDTATQIWRRYLRYRTAISKSVFDACLEVKGRRASVWVAYVSYESISTLLRQRNLDVREAAIKAGVRYRDIKMMDDGLATPDLVIRLSAALELAPQEFLEEKDHLPQIPMTNAETFIRSASGAAEFVLSLSASLMPDPSEIVTMFLSQAGDFARRIAVADSSDVQDAATHTRVSDDDALEIESFLMDAIRAEIMFVFSHEVRFVPSRVSMPPNTFCPINVLHIQALQVDEWPPGSSASSDS